MIRTFLKGYARLFFVALIVGLLSGCASMSTMQTARTVGKGEFGIGGGIGKVETDLRLGDLDTISLTAPFLEAYGRFGITEKLDVGLKITIIGTYSGDVKYQFLGDQESLFAGSIGGGIGYMEISSGDNKSKIFDLMCPAFFSIHPAPVIGLYVSPKYVLRINSFKNETESGTSNSNWYGLTGGLRFGKKVAFFCEYSFFRNSEIDSPFRQVTVGLSYGIK